MPAATTRSTVKNPQRVAPHRYAGIYGCRYDADAGLTYLRQRWYDSASFQRFVGRDPLPLPNLYLYSACNPVLYVDPSGCGFWTGVADALLGVTIVGLAVAGVMSVGVPLALAAGVSAGSILSAVTTIGTTATIFGTAMAGVSMVQAATGVGWHGESLTTDQRLHLAGQASVGLTLSGLSYAMAGTTWGQLGAENDINWIANGAKFFGKNGDFSLRAKTSINSNDWNPLMLPKIMGTGPTSAARCVGPMLSPGSGLAPYMTIDPNNPYSQSSDASTPKPNPAANNGNDYQPAVVLFDQDGHATGGYTLNGVFYANP